MKTLSAFAVLAVASTEAAEWGRSGWGGFSSSFFGGRSSAPQRRGGYGGYGGSSYNRGGYGGVS